MLLGSRELALDVLNDVKFKTQSASRPRFPGARQKKKRTHSHHLGKLAPVDIPIVVLVAPFDKVEQVVDQPRLDRRAVSEGIDRAERSAEDAQVRVDFEGVLVVLVRKEGRDALSEGVHGCAYPTAPKSRDCLAVRINSSDGETIDMRRLKRGRTNAGTPQREAAVDPVLRHLAARGILDRVHDLITLDFLDPRIQDHVDLVAAELFLRGGKER